MTLNVGHGDTNRFKAVEFSPMTDWVVRGTGGTIQQRLFSAGGPLLAVLDLARMSSL